MRQFLSSTAPGPVPFTAATGAPGVHRESISIQRTLKINVMHPLLFVTTVDLRPPRTDGCVF